jgi:hypothetical protein
MKTLSNTVSKKWYQCKQLIELAGKKVVQEQSINKIFNQNYK